MASKDLINGINHLLLLLTAGLPLRSIYCSNQPSPEGNGQMGMVSSGPLPGLAKGLLVVALASRARVDQVLPPAGNHGRHDSVVPLLNPSPATILWFADYSWYPRHQDGPHVLAPVLLVSASWG